ncbi:MAG TPA: hypothetical protein DCQ64_00830, partial [Candidatus Rokubacteria bacterium]|nr:hypothetical protein [Candidatus Rokubacteria bacterium]
MGPIDPAAGSALRTPRTSVVRHPERAAYDFETIAAVLDEGLFCHLGFVADGQPYVIPTNYARRDRTLYLHGSPASRMLRTLAGGVPLCVTVSLIDGLVLARSGFASSVNYRSVVILGTGTEVTGQEKREALERIIEHIVPGRLADIRRPDESELRATAVLGVPITEASAKVRSGPPREKTDEDWTLEGWAGVLPLRLVPGTPQPCPRLAPGTPVPDYVRRYARPGSPPGVAAGGETIARAGMTPGGVRVGAQPPQRAGRNTRESPAPTTSSRAVLEPIEGPPPWSAPLAASAADAGRPRPPRRCHRPPGGPGLRPCRGGACLLGCPR